MPAPATNGPPADVVEREKEFYDHRSRSYDILRRVIYRASGEFRRYDDLNLFFDPAGKEVLEYGCGPGVGTPSLMARGPKHVTGFDVSEGEIEVARERAVREGYADRVDYLVADAHALSFDDDAFDLIVGGSILHHLDLPVALRELRRVLRPGGRAVFSEPLAHHPFLRLMRSLTPAARTDDEHPITKSDWDTCREVFPDFEHQEFEFITVPLMPLNLITPLALQRKLAPHVNALDDRVLARFPRLRPYARLTFLVLK